MILEFSVENTYSIKERQTISFEAADDIDDEHIINTGGKRLLKLAAIYGANASGKSNIIKAFIFYIRFILDSFTELKPQQKIPFEPFLFTEKPEQPSGFFEIIFYFENVWYKYQIRLNKINVLNEYFAIAKGGEETVIFSFDADNSDHIYPEDYKELLRFVRPNATFLSTAAQFNHALLGKIYRHLKNGIVVPGESALSQYTRNMLLHDQIKTSDITAFLGKAGIDHLGGIDVAVGKKVLFLAAEFGPRNNSELRAVDSADKNRIEKIAFSHIYDEKNYTLPFSSESMGTRRLFELAGPLLDCIHHEKNIFIDEIESSLHDDLLVFFVRTFLENTRESQLLFTTHNQNLLDSDLLRNDEIWFAQKDDSGGSGFFSLAEFKDVPENVSRRDLYKAGAFGALPRTSKYFKE